MRTKKYEFTEYEMLAIRNALIEEHQRLKKVFPKSPIAKQMKLSVEALKEQFERDCCR